MQQRRPYQHDNRGQQRPQIKTKKYDVKETYLALKEDYSKRAKIVLEELFEQDGKNVIKTNQVRNIYSLVLPFFEYFNYGNLPDETKTKDNLKKIKIKIAYQIGRDKQNRRGDWELGIKTFNDITNVLELIDLVLDSKDFFNDLKLYANYFEALVAYHRFFESGGNK
ncbi:type III-A CRISPR-associated protein Csm2 [archaeon]|jgi:CRISPR type III-A-associated protein Csm2|nr:type III-A CRISPR-associated protein Csm2 [Acholeplasmataceae bacterium]MCK9293258.1 type III-A CRISPR-associated protein Csm2 [archaeon]MCK9439459.1 type III-A CRISPR-associated protein Csm2 [Patescibacteria group bacterium]